MHQSWKWKLLLSLGLLVLAGYLLVPTYVYFSLTESQAKEVRKEKGALAKYLPAWSPSAHIVPGLDLQGGIHMVLGVDVDKALTDRASRTADRLREFATEQKVAFLSIDPPQLENDEFRIRVNFNTAEDRKQFSQKIMEKFGDLQVNSEQDKSLVLRLDPNLVQATRRDAVDQTIHTIRSRIDKMGVTEPSISKRGENQIQIQLPGYENPEEAKSLIGRTAQLEFQMCDDDTDFLTKLTDLPTGVELVKSAYGRPDNTAGQDIFLQFPARQLEAVRTYLANKVPAEHAIKFGTATGEKGGPMRTYTVFKKVDLTGDDLVDARVSMGSMDNPRPSVVISFSPTGARVFEDLSGNNIGRRLAIVLEDRVDSAPVFQQRISGGASITMGGARTREEMLRDANQLSLVLKSGALPAPVTFREERSVGPSLGADSVRNGMRAFMVGTFLVIIFMMFYYRVSGFVSIIGLFFNVVLMLAIFSWLGATLTLPGIAGLLLTVGMSVDANVIINERIREELRRGKMPRSAIGAGYDAALSAVLDTHITTFISGIVLWQYGTGPVQNFATTLMIGTMTSLFTAVVITHIFFDMLTRNGPKELSI